MKKVLLSLFAVSAISLSAMSQEPFFTEYVDGASVGADKALEIYNPTSSSIDLTNYMMKGTGNAATTWEYDYEFPAGATIAAHDVYVLCATGSSQSILDVADYVVPSDQFHVGFNGNDCRGLFKKTSGDPILLDLIGNPVNEAGDFYFVAGVTLVDAVIIRKSTITTGNTSWTASAGTNTTDSEWIVTADDYSNLGSFDGASAVNTVKSVTFTMYPNPVSSTVYIVNDNASKIVASNSIGQQLIRIENAKNNEQISVADLQAGMYFVSVTDQNGNVSVKKLIKK